MGLDKTELRASINIGDYAYISILLEIEKNEINRYLNADNLSDLYKEVHPDLLNFEAVRHVFVNSLLIPFRYFTIDFGIDVHPYDVEQQWVSNKLRAVFKFFQVEDRHVDVFFNKLSESVSNENHTSAILSVRELFGVRDTQLEFNSSKSARTSIISASKKLSKDE